MEKKTRRKKERRGRPKVKASERRKAIHVMLPGPLADRVKKVRDRHSWLEELITRSLPE